MTRDHHDGWGWLWMAVAALALAGLAAACGTSSPPFAGPGRTNPAASRSNQARLPYPDSGSQPGKVAGAQLITFDVVGSSEGARGPDGRQHDTFRATSSTSVVAGRPVTVEITNFDDMPHSFTIPELGIDRLVPAAGEGQAGEVTFTFTANVSGTYRWFCALPCDQDNDYWAMGPDPRRTGGMMGGAFVGTGMMEPGVDGFMAGYVAVTAG